MTSKEMVAYGILSPERELRALAWWGWPESQMEHNAWTRFFTDSDLAAPLALPLADGIRAYEAIGFRCVRFVLVEAELGKESKDGD